MHPEFRPSRRSALWWCGSLLLGAALTGGGCASSSSPGKGTEPLTAGAAAAAPKFEIATSDTLLPFRNADLRLVRLVHGGDVVKLPDPNPITLRLADGGKIAGRSAVNRYFGRFDVTPDGKLSWPPAALGMTRMAGSPEAMALENQFTDSLTSSVSLLVGQDRLRFESADGRHVVEFSR